MKGVWIVVATIAGVLAIGPTANAQDTVRIAITSVADTTFQFSTSGRAWIHAGTTGIAVDPRRHDVLVARLKVLRVDGGVATALVTGQTTAVTTQHVVVLIASRPPWRSQRAFWLGLGLGAFAGFVLGKT